MYGDKTSVTVNDYVILSERVERTQTSTQTTAQVVAAEGDTLTVIPWGGHGTQEVKRSDVQAYSDVYGTAIPVEGARPIVNMMQQ